MSGPQSAEPTALDVAALPAHQLARRRRIIVGAMELLEREEYEQIQIRHVAEQAGVALGTLYRYFNSKEHLYAAVLLDWAGPFWAKQDPAEQKLPPEQRLRRRMRGAIRAFERRPQYFRVQSLLQISSDPHAKSLYAEFALRNQEAVGRELAGMPKQKAQDSVMILMSVLSQMLAAYAFHGKPVEEVYRVMDLCVDLIVTTLPS
ncbi:TetR/AcrR family transcriptional regulator [Streptomyces albipurpureus]|uniref:TetR family transcriptional regulator n=1 Tax=Streptomyces albipurpureus TaxID=2897419 RepID=A0ABT0UNH6_9ACTN|nr:TetR/AcrR family transcriptional regulator [Streptomyces sp. CWNU-1]MCM2389645.1 TetR family transcriptional regulator [Streptomyces sp. CWNU-1]